MSNEMTDRESIFRYGVVGNPVAHSLSPVIHRLFAEQTGETLTYKAIEAPLDGFSETVERFFAAGGAGLNVTVPFKQEAFALARRHSARARLAGAANTLWLEDGALYADNTDGAGLIADLKKNHQVPLKGRHILLLGAGGVARGALPSLLAEAPASITLANRTVSKAEAIVAALTAAPDAATDTTPIAVTDTAAGEPRPVLSARSYTDLEEARYDLIINATSLGLHGDTPPVPPQSMAPDCCCYDMQYSIEVPTPFQTWARANGAAQAIDGLGMLIEQAAESFRQWHTTRPDTAPILTALRGKRT